MNLRKEIRLWEKPSGSCLTRLAMGGRHTIAMCMACLTSLGHIGQKPLVTRTLSWAEDPEFQILATGHSHGLQAQWKTGFLTTSICTTWGFCGATRSKTVFQLRVQSS